MVKIEEIQDGIGVIDSDYVMDMIKERKIRSNICPSSNRILGAVSNMKSH